ncbi:MAG: hypothetical protein QNJ22_23190 [Desulfosarcinaceae bacterium]|nr:hypothetical protein [Desulfosarcinaceae bacterium]
MKSILIRKWFVVAVAGSGVLLNLAYSFDLLRLFFDPQYSASVREIMISAIVLEIGWASLLVWVILKPFENHHILLVTVIPILLGNMLHSLAQIGANRASFSAIALNTVFGVLYSGLYVVAFMAGKTVKSRERH